MGSNDPLSTETDLDWTETYLNKQTIVSVENQGHCDWFWDENAINVYIDKFILNIENKDDI